MYICNEQVDWRALAAFGVLLVFDCTGSNNPKVTALKTSGVARRRAAVRNQWPPDGSAVLQSGSEAARGFGVRKTFEGDVGYGLQR